MCDAARLEAVNHHLDEPWVRGTVIERTIDILGEYFGRGIYNFLDGKMVWVCKPV